MPLTPEETAELAELEKQFGNSAAAPQGLTPEEEAEFQALDAEFGEPKDTGFGGAVQAGISGLAQGLTFGFSDEIAAFANEALGGEAYDVGLAKMREHQKRMEKAQPEAYIAGDVAGSLALPLGGLTKGVKGAKAIAKAGAKAGAAIGAVEAAGRTEEELLSKEGLSDVAKGALLGAATGGSANIVGKGVKSIGKGAKSAAKGTKDFVSQRVAKDIELANPKIKIDVTSLFEEGKAKKLNQAIDKAIEKMPTKDLFGAGDIGPALLGWEAFAGKKTYDIIKNPEHRVKFYKAVTSSANFAKKVGEGAKKLNITEPKALKLAKKNLAKSLDISPANIAAAESAMVDPKDVEASDIALATLPAGKLKILGAAKRMDPKKAKAAMKALSSDKTKGKDEALKSIYRELIQTVKEGGILRRDQADLLYKLMDKFNPPK